MTNVNLEEKLRALHAEAHRSLPMLEQALAERPDDLPLRQTVAELCAQLGHTARAVSHYMVACDAYALMGQSLYAIAVCQRILLIDPSHQATQQRLARLYAGRPRETEAELSAADEAATTSSAAPPPQLDLAAFRQRPEANTNVEPLAPVSVSDVTPAQRLARVPLFSSLSPEEFVTVLETALQTRVFDAGETIIAEGSTDDAMYAVVQGHVVVERALGDTVVVVDTMTAGDFFGEIALLAQTKRLVTVRAETPTITLRIERGPMLDVLARSPQVKTVVEDFCRARLLSNWMRASPLFRPLGPRMRQELRKEMERLSVPAGRALVTVGAPGDAIYLLVRGRCVVEGVEAEHYPDMVEGDSFGEISVIRDIPATATVTSATDCLVLRLPKQGALSKALEHPSVRPLIERVVRERLQRTDALLHRFD